MHKILLAVLLLAGVGVAASVPQSIYIGSFGHSDDADRLRLLLADGLTSDGYKVVENADAADATLSGVLTVQNVQQRTEAHVTAMLVDKDGNRVWKGDYGSSFHPGNDAVKWLHGGLRRRLGDHALAENQFDDANR